MERLVRKNVFAFLEENNMFIANKYSVLLNRDSVEQLLRLLARVLKHLLDNSNMDCICVKFGNALLKFYSTSCPHAARSQKYRKRWRIVTCL